MRGNLNKYALERERVGRDVDEGKNVVDNR